MTPASDDTASDDTASDITEDLQELDRLLARSRFELSEGRTLEMAPLEHKVQVMCGRLRRLPTAEAQAHRTSLLSLLDEMGRLAGQIEQRRDELAQNLGETSKRRQATTAYAKPPPAER